MALQVTNQCSDVLTVCVSREGLPADVFRLHVVHTALRRGGAQGGPHAPALLPPSDPHGGEGRSVGTPRWSAAPSNRVAWPGDENDVPIIPGAWSARPLSSGGSSVGSRGGARRSARRNPAAEGGPSSSGGSPPPAAATRGSRASPSPAHSPSAQGGGRTGSRLYATIAPRVDSPSRFADPHQHIDKWSKPGRASVHAAPDVSGAGLLRTQAPPSPARSPPRAAQTSAGSPGAGARPPTSSSVAHTGRSKHAGASGLSPRTAAADVAALDVAPGLSLVVELRVFVPASLASSGEFLGTLAVSCSATTGASERVGVPVYLRVAAPGAAWATEAGGAGRRAPVADAG